MLNERLFSLGERLGACAEFVREGHVTADIGTDHAYLPIWLVSTGKIPRSYASDINEEPIKSARINIKKQNLCDKVITFTGTGLEKIPQNDVDDIVIAGMGGDNIVGILSAAKWLQNSRYRLILQPMSKAEKLREYLYANNFNILAEKAICEANRIYTVICAEFSQSSIEYSDFDIYAGRLDNKNETAVRLLQKQVAVLLAESQGHVKGGDIEYARKLECIANKLQNYINQGSVN